VLEASRVLAENLSAEENTPAEKITKAFRLIVCRKPSIWELKTLETYYNDQLQEFAQNKLSAEKTIEKGEYRMNKKINLNQSAALMKVINILYNLEETIVKT